MKYVILISAIAGLVVCRLKLPNYNIETDDVDIDAVIADLSSLQAYSNCFLDKGPCTTVAQRYRDVTQDSVIYACDRCTVLQKQQYAKYLEGLKTRLPQDYQSFRQKYDPEYIYLDALEAEVFQFWNAGKSAHS